jgi:hypothetical protein
MADVDRPVAFSLPLAAPGFHPAVTFELADRERCVAVLHQFAGWLQPMLAQFCLAASMSAHQPTLGAGSWEILRGGDLLAVVDLRLGRPLRPPPRRRISPAPPGHCAATAKRRSRPNSCAPA